MADFLKINQIPLPVANDNAGEKRELIGDSERAFSGAVLSSIRARKRTWSFSTIPIPSATAAAWLSLLGGEGDHFDFDSVTYYMYSSRGLGNSAGSATRETTTPSPKFGTAYLGLGAGDQVTWPCDLDNNWTLMVWLWDGAAWGHWILCSDGTKYRDGAVYGGTISWLAVASTEAVLGDTGSGVAQYFDDFVAVSFVIPAAWAAILGAATAAFSDLPRLKMTGDLTEDGLINVETDIESIDSTYTQFYDSTASAWDDAGRVLSFDLREV